MCIPGGNFNNILGHLFSGTREFTAILNIILQRLSSQRWCPASDLEFFIKLYLVPENMAALWVISPVVAP